MDLVRSNLRPNIVYVVDSRNHIIREISTTGIVTRTVGITGTPGFVDGIALGTARLRTPMAISVNASDAVFIADTGNHAVRVFFGGVVRTLAGNGVAGNATGASNVTQFSSPSGIAVDSLNCYVSDTMNNVIKAILLSTNVSRIIAGTGALGWADASLGSGVLFSSPKGLRIRLGTGQLFVSDNSTRVRIVTIATGATRTLTGAGFAGFGDGSFETAQFSDVSGMAVSDDGTVLIVADAGNAMVRKLDLTYLLASRLAGTGINGMPISAGSFSNTAMLSSPRGVVIEASGSILVAAYDSNTIARVTCPTAIIVPPPTTSCDVTLFAGSFTQNGGTNVALAPLASRFGRIMKHLTIGNGTIFIADEFNHAIRGISLSSPNPVVSWIVGNGTSTVADGIGTSAALYSPVGITYDNSSGAIYIVEYWPCAVFRLWPLNSSLTKIAGGAYPTPCTFAEGNFMSTAKFNYPWGIVADPTQNRLFLADSSNNRVRILDMTTQTTSTLAGTSIGYLDGIGTNAQLKSPKSLAIDSINGLLYLSDESPSLRLIVIATGQVTTLLGTSLGWLDGIGLNAMISPCESIALDNNGGLILVERDPGRIRRYDLTTALVTTLAGQVPLSTPFSADGMGTAAAFSMPRGIAIDTNGTIYIADGTSLRSVVCSAAAQTTTAVLLPPTVSELPRPTMTPTPSTTPLTTSNACRLVTTAGYGGRYGFADGLGVNSFFNAPRGIAVTAANDRGYISDSGNNAIRMFVPSCKGCTFSDVNPHTGNVTTAAGTGAQGWADSPTGAFASFFAPEGLALSLDELTLFVADTLNHMIRSITVCGNTAVPCNFAVTTIAGLLQRPGYVDGAINVALFNLPANIVLGARGIGYGTMAASDNVLIISERGNSVIRIFSLTTQITSTLAGNPNAPSFADGVGTFAAFLQPTGLTIASDGAIFVSDSL